MSSVLLTLKELSAGGSKEGALTLPLSLEESAKHWQFLNSASLDSPTTGRGLLFSPLTEPLPGDDNRGDSNSEPP